jgi:methylated-DNA-[protein]-cysteine S-methyltransferase
MPASQLCGGAANSLATALLLAKGRHGAAAPYHRAMALPRCFTLFATALGTCAIAWNEIGVTGVWLPEANAESLRRKVARRCQGARQSEAAGAIAAVVESITRLLAGARVDLRAVPVDSTGIDDFDRRVYAVTRTIPAGRVLSYGEVAVRVGADATARAVGESLGRNAMPIVVPCHRVVATGGGLGGFSAPGGTATKRRMLAIEDAQPDGPPGLFDSEPPEPSDGGAGASGRQPRSDH